MKQLIVNADDLGICESTNRAIAKAYRRGILTSTSLMANGPALGHALEHVVWPNPDLGVGLHVCLVAAKSLLPPDQLPLLVDDRGEFRRGFVSLLGLTLTKRRAVVDEIEREVAAQFEALLAHGVVIDHVDSHRHVHMIPAVFEVVTRLARRYGCPAVRVTHEALPSMRALLRPSRMKRLAGNAAKKLVLSTFALRDRAYLDGLVAPDRVIGLLDSGRVDLHVLQNAIDSAADGVTEIMTHPSKPDPDVRPEAGRLERHFLCSPGRQVEFEALVAFDLPERIDRAGCGLVRYLDLSGREPSKTRTAVTAQGLG